MRPELETYHLIQRYLSNELSELERIAFENEIEQNPQLAEEIEYQQAVNLVVEGASQHELREKINIDISAIPHAKPFNWNKFFGFGIGLILLGIIGIAIWPKKKETTSISISKNSTTIVEENKNTSTPPISSINHSSKATNTTLYSDKANDEAQSETQNLTFNNTKVEQEEKNTSLSNLSTNQEKPNEIAEQQKVNCGDINWEVPITTQPSCHDKANGSIAIDATKIKGGKEPFVFQLNQHTSKSTHYFQLESGTYAITILDENGCKFERTLEIEEKLCSNMNATFSPNIGEQWHSPSRNEDYTLKIMTRVGRILFQQHVISGTIVSWDGVSNSGEELDAGLYIYQLEYANGKTESGQITLMR